MRLCIRRVIKKIIIGLLGDKGSGKTTVSAMLSEMGFHRISILSKVREIAKYLLPGDDWPEETLDQIRERGYKVNKTYWINLTLGSAPEDKDLIVIDDLKENDVISSVIRPICVFRDGVSKENTSKIEILANNSDLNSLRKSIQDKFRKSA